MAEPRSTSPGRVLLHIAPDVREHLERVRLRIRANNYTATIAHLLEAYEKKLAKPAPPRAESLPGTPKSRARFLREMAHVRPLVVAFMLLEKKLFEAESRIGKLERLTR